MHESPGRNHVMLRPPPNSAAPQHRLNAKRLLTVFYCQACWGTAVTVSAP
jgi:hypothetical protein